MAIKTKKEVVQEILYSTYGGMPSNDASISENFVLRLLNNRIAEAVPKSAFATYNIDGCVCADDIFFLTYTLLTLLTDTTLGLKYFALPAQPVGLPSSRSIIISPPANRGGVRADLFKPISRGEVTFVRSLPGLKKVFHYIENGRLYFIDEFSIIDTFTSLNLSLISSGANDLTAFLNLPDDMITGIKMSILQELRVMIGMSDNIPIPPADAPEPRKS